MNNAQLINQASGKQDWQTPPAIVEAARRVMGHIDLDPASNAHANETVQALVYFDRYGLERRWFGNVWLNFPFGREENPAWVAKLVDEYESGHIRQACCICYAATSEQWFAPLYAFPMCFLAPRTSYVDPATGLPARGVSKGSVVTGLGVDLDSFLEEFEPMGHVMWRVDREKD